MKTHVLSILALSSLTTSLLAASALAQGGDSKLCMLGDDCPYFAATGSAQAGVANLSASNNSESKNGTGLAVSASGHAAVAGLSSAGYAGAAATGEISGVLDTQGRLSGNARMNVFGGTNAILAGTIQYENSSMLGFSDQVIRAGWAPLSLVIPFMSGDKSGHFYFSTLVGTNFISSLSNHWTGTSVSGGVGNKAELSYGAQGGVALPAVNVNVAFARDQMTDTLGRTEFNADVQVPIRAVSDHFAVGAKLDTTRYDDSTNPANQISGTGVYATAGGSW